MRSKLCGTKRGASERNPGDDESKRTYLFKDGKRQMSQEEIINLVFPPGCEPNPTDDAERLKAHRRKMYNADEQNFIDMRKLDGLDISVRETDIFYHAWLKRELKVIARWVDGAERPPLQTVTGVNLNRNTQPESKRVLPSVSNQIEISKYEKYVKEEMARIAAAVNNVPEQVDSPETFEYDREKAIKIYDFCMGDAFNAMPLQSFLPCVENADFSRLKQVPLRGSKFKYSIYILSFSIGRENQKSWYRKAAESIGTTPAQCSGANVPEHWKKTINAMK